MNSHNGKQDQMCYLCSTMFATKSTLKKHMLNIHNDPTASCSSCGLKCKPSSLNRHEKLCKLSDEEREARKVNCNQCGKSLSNREKLKIHIREKHNHEKLLEA